VNVARLSNVIAIDRDYTRGVAKTSGRPFEAYVEVAARCNLKCPMCPITVDPRYLPGSGRPALLTQELFERLEPLFPKLSRIHLFGLGEPILNPHLTRWVEQLAGAGVEVWITTNGTLINEARADALARAGLSRVTVSIDGTTRETYERIRRSGRLEDALRGIRALGAARRRHGRPRLFLSMVGMASNLAELPSLVDLCHEAGGDGVYLEELYPFEHPLIEEFCQRENLGRLPAERVHDLLATAASRAAALGLEWSCRLADQAAWAAPESDAANAGPIPTPAPPHATGALPWACSEPWTTINVNASGEVRTCCFNPTVMGQLHEAPIEAIWEGAGFLALREDHAAGRTPAGCANCVANGRVKQSPFLFAGRPLPAVGPEPTRETAVLDVPAPGSVVSGSLILSGTHGVRRPWKKRRKGLPDVFIDRTLVARLAQCRQVDTERFAELVPIPYVTAGKHRLSLRWPRQRGTERWEHREIQVADAETVGGAIVGIDRTAVALHLRQPEGPPRLSIDGRPHPLLSWMCSAAPRGWLGVAVLDVTPIAPGRHDCEFGFGQEGPHQRTLWRLPFEKEKPRLSPGLWNESAQSAESRIPS
jgi:MoaA/NifB/PqqE/SkfB family radical SAM enzyme